MGIRIFIDAVTRGVGSAGALGLLSANGQKLTTVLGNVLPGTIASVGVRGAPAGVAAATLTGTLSTSRTRAFTGVASAGSVGTLSTGANSTRWGFNLAGLEWMSYAYSRAANSTSPNRDYGVARDSLIKYMQLNGFTVSRLPFLWEYIQPVLNNQGAQSNILNAYGITASGQLNPQAVRQITDVLNSHQTAGIKCMLDMHNYCRYTDFIWNADGSVPGFTIPGNPSMPYSSTGATQQRIFSQGAASLTQANYSDVWRRIALQFKGHPGLGGYMIMNEPHDMDNNATWPQYAQACINAIRAVDASTPIYVGGNNFSNSTTIGTSNPGFPLSGINLIYEAHMYLDASSSGAFFNWDSEVAKGFSVGEAGSINTNTGFNRLKYTTDWLTSNVQKGAVTECGFPTSDSRWTQSFKSATDLAWSKGLEWYTWMMGDHWPIHGQPIGANPEYHQGQSFEGLVAGIMKSSMGLNSFKLYDASTSFGNGSAGQVVTVTLFCRGNVQTTFNVTVTRTTGAGTLSTGTVAMPAGANPSATFTYTAAANEVATLTYSGPSQVPPVRSIYNLSNPVTFAATSLTDAGRALLAKYGAAEWVASNGAKDYVGNNTGLISTAGETVRGIWDSGFASTKDNTFGMVQWITTGTDYGTMSPPTKAISGGFHKLDTIGATTSNWGTSLSQVVSPVQGNLNKVEGFIWDASNPSLTFNLIPTYANVATIWSATFAGPSPNTNNNGDGSLEFKFFNNINATQVQALRARGTKAVLAVGGASNGYNITTRAQSTAFLNTFATIAGQLGGLDGISLEFFQGGVGSSVNELLFIVQSLRAQFGQQFLVTSMPDPQSAADQSLLGSLFSGGALSWAMPQYFQSATWAGNTAGIQTNLDTWKTLFGGTASAVMAAFPCNSSQNAGPTVAECVTVYNAYVAANPNFRGVVGWTAQINQSSTTSSGGGNVFGLSCRKHDNKAQPFGGTGLEDPTNPVTVLFDIQDQHFVIGCVELQNTASDGAIFNTSNAQQGAFSELGLANGGMPTAKWQDYNGNAISIQGVTGLSAGAHVLSMQSTGSAQLLRVDKTQVTAGARILSANGGVSSDQHQIGWRYYNFFERGTPGCFIYGVIAGRGNPSSSELTVMERYLGNTYAGLSL